VLISFRKGRKRRPAAQPEVFNGQGARAVRSDAHWQQVESSVDMWTFFFVRRRKKKKKKQLRPLRTPNSAHIPVNLNRNYFFANIANITTAIVASCSPWTLLGRCAD
jgi:hypothetical protein